jgi:cytochrome c2
MKSLYCAVAMMIFISCNHKNIFRKVLNQDHLLSQVFDINIDRDTILSTKSGCIIKIPRGSLQSDSADVKIEIKEAINVTDIVLAGLITQSDKQPLSSGGMIYFNAASGYNITIKKAVEVLVPSKEYNRQMNVYAGVKEDDGSINWKMPTPLPPDSTTTKIDMGEKLFKSSCANCHKIYDEYVAPALVGVTERRTKKWLYDFTRHASEMATNTPFINQDSTDFFDPYSLCLKKRYGGLVMTSFPDLSDYDLDALYSYIKSESSKRPDLQLVYAKTCCDSCESYFKETRKLYAQRRNYVPPPVNSKVVPNRTDGVYYTINITATGWYNLDCLLKEYDDCKSSELFVRIQGKYTVNLNVVLIIPSVKLFIEGGKLKNVDDYGFDEDNGKILLPQSLQAYILAFGEYDNKILFGKTLFNSQLKQTIDISISETTKEKMTSDIKAMKLDDVTTDIRKAKNADKIAITDKKINEAEKLKPKNCDCDLGIYTVPELVNGSK